MSLHFVSSRQPTFQPIALCELLIVHVNVSCDMSVTVRISQRRYQLDLAHVEQERVDPATVCKVSRFSSDV